jgi:hypothetical protein
MKICSVPLCGRKHLALGFCTAHYQRHKSGQDMEPPIRFDRIHPRKKNLAVEMWLKGFDTYDIAQKLGVPEARIYNRLPAWRGLPADNERPQWNGEEHRRRA